MDRSPEKDQIECRLNDIQSDLDKMENRLQGAMDSSPLDMRRERSFKDVEYSMDEPNLKSKSYSKDGLREDVTTCSQEQHPLEALGERSQADQHKLLEQELGHKSKVSSMLTDFISESSKLLDQKHTVSPLKEEEDTTQGQSDCRREVFKSAEGMILQSIKEEDEE